MEKYANYTRCGEIFKSPHQSDRSPYILKCFTCSDVFLLLESFIFHIEDYCKQQEDPSATTAVTEIKTETPTQQEEFSVEMLDENSDTDVNNGPGMQMDTSDVKNQNMYQTFSDGTDSNVEPTDRDSLIEVRNEPIADNDDVCVDEGDIYVSDVFDYDADDNDQKENDKVVAQYAVEELDEDTESADEDPLSTNFCSLSDETGSMYFVRRFMESPKKVITFIRTYKKYPELWNSKMFPQSDQNQETFLESFTKELKHRLRCNISILNISQIISHLQTAVKNDLASDRNASQATEQKPEWYLEYLDFLRPFVDTFQLDSPLIPFHIILIIKIYKTFPHLWDSCAAEYYCQNKRSESEMLMLRTIQYRLNLKLTQIELQNILRRIHNFCSKGKHQSDNDVEVSNYYDHLKFLKDHVAPFTCPNCSEHFDSALLMRAHLSKHNGRNTLICSICSKGFKMTGPYLIHVRRHMKDFQEMCDLCGKKFLTSTELEAHVVSHSKNIRYMCKTCDSSFANEVDLTEHMKTHQKKVLYKCRACEIVFTTKDAVETHLRLHHNKGNLNNICNTCGKSFVNARALSTHEIQHKGLGKFKCGKCGRILRTKYNYVQHMRTHGIRITFKGESGI